MLFKKMRSRNADGRTKKSKVVPQCAEYIGRLIMDALEQDAGQGLLFEDNQ